MKKKAVIQLKRVTKTYTMGDTKVHALAGVDLDIMQGEFIAILGPSGSGKSTLMHAVGALERPSTGKIIVDGIDISDLSESEVAAVRGKKIGFVFQQFNLIPTISAEQNVSLPLLFQGVPTKERSKRAKDLLKQVGLGDRTHHKPSELSGGQQQRVAIARALANKPPIILADEPTGNLDTKTGKEIMNLLQELHKSGRTIILVTHDKSLIKFAQRVIYLRDGKIERIDKRRLR
jgi:putative ABC transport system ATP-binding protein